MGCPEDVVCLEDWDLLEDQDWLEDLEIVGRRGVSWKTWSRWKIQSCQKTFTPAPLETLDIAETGRPEY